MTIILLILLVIAIAILIFFFNQYQKVKKTQSELSEKESEEFLAQLFGQDDPILDEDGKPVSGNFDPENDY